jgi:signal transduction histidine kinase
MMDEDVIPWLRDVSPEDSRRIIEALYRVHRLFSAVTDLDALLERIMEESKRVAQAEACSLMLYDVASEELYFQVAQGETGDQQELKRRVRLKLGQGVAGAAALTRSVANIPEAMTDPRFYAEADAISGFRTRSLLAAPLVDRDSLVGVVELLNKDGGGSFTEADCHVMEMFSSLAASAIVNARLIEDNLRAERMAAVGEAVAGLSHYIKNLITGMVSSTDLIDTGLQSNRRDVVDVVWPIFKRIVRRMTIFVQDMLAFSKPREPIRERCDMMALAEEVADTFRGLTPQKQVSVEVISSVRVVPAYVDSKGVFSCLLNLVMNAGDAVDSETGIIRISIETVKNGASTDIIVEVSDNGEGVPEDHCAKIFDPFFSTKGSKGTGLGLAVTRKTVREHGGDITVTRAPEGGALFRMVFPNAGHPQSHD